MKAHLAWLVLIASAAGCGVGGGDSPPAADAGPGTGDGAPPVDGADGSLPTSGLLLRFEPDPAIPASLGGPNSVELDRRAFFDLREIRVIGDAAPGDERTYRDELHLDWHCGEEEEGEEEGGESSECEHGDDPYVISFPDAPGGIYSSLLARVEKYKFEGKATTDLERDGKIEEQPDELDLTVSLPDVALSSGGLTEIIVTVAVDSPVLPVDWDLVTPDGEGKLVVGPSSPQIAAVRDQVRAAFAVTSIR